MKIDCHECSMFQSDHCSDCLVTVMLHPGDVVEIDEDLDDSLQMLSGAGLIPTLKFRPRGPSPGTDGSEGDAAKDVAEAG
jgi:hypothetical protein